MFAVVKLCTSDTCLVLKVCSGVRVESLATLTCGNHVLCVKQSAHGNDVSLASFPVEPGNEASVSLSQPLLLKS